MSRKRKVSPSPTQENASGSKAAGVVDGSNPASALPPVVLRRWQDMAEAETDRVRGRISDPQKARDKLVETLNRDVHCDAHRTTLYPSKHCPDCRERLKVALHFGTTYLAKGVRGPRAGPSPDQDVIDAQRALELKALLGLPSYFHLPKGLADELKSSPDSRVDEVLERWEAGGGHTLDPTCEGCRARRHQRCSAPASGSAGSREKVCQCFCKYLCEPCRRGASVEGEGADHRACSKGDCACATCEPDPAARAALKAKRRKRWSTGSSALPQPRGEADGSSQLPTRPQERSHLAAEALPQSEHVDRAEGQRWLTKIKASLSQADGDNE
jgi:hypothetical protein